MSSLETPKGASHGPASLASPSCLLTCSAMQSPAALSWGFVSRGGAQAKDSALEGSRPGNLGLGQLLQPVLLALGRYLVF